jgi:hypothetical protein
MRLPIRTNLHHYMHKISDMLSWMECVQRWYPETKGTRLYSLLPLGSSYAAAFMKINASVLCGLCGGISKQHGIALLDIPDKHVCKENTTSSKPRDSAAEALRRICT